MENGDRKELEHLRSDINNIGADFKLHIHDTDEKFQRVYERLGCVEKIVAVGQNDMKRFNEDLKTLSQESRDWSKKTAQITGLLSFITPIATALIIWWITNAR